MQRSAVKVTISPTFAATKGDTAASQPASCSAKLGSAPKLALDVSNKPVTPASICAVHLRIGALQMKSESLSDGIDASRRTC